MGDTFDRFQPSERGRFGDNEIRRGEVRKSDLVDIDMALHVDRPAAVLVSLHGDRTAAVWLPKSQIEVLMNGPIETKKHGVAAQPCTVTLPQWLAKEKGIA